MRIQSDSKTKLKVFVDFDGTITKLDVGDTMFETFGGEQCRDIIARYRRVEFSAVECFRQECIACGEVNKESLDAFLDRQEIDVSFGAFLEFCRERQIECIVVSDGMDYYIKRILDRFAFRVPFISNTLLLAPTSDATKVRFQPSFPSTDEVCDRCACCKRNQMLTMCADDDIIAYVGEGYSDRCPVQYADVIFAKDELLTYCMESNIPYYEYNSFADVVGRLMRMLGEIRSGSKSRFHKRRQAQLASRATYLGG